MASNVIHIYGASGSGTTTLAKYISEKLGYFFMDTDDYFWQPTNPPYTTKRDVKERLKMMRRDIAKEDKVVISGSLVDWGDELIPLFTLAIRLKTDTNIRMERLKRREHEHFGTRIDAGGDMYRNHLEFIEWAASYDEGDLNMRSKAKHDEWEKLLPCRKIILDGNGSLEHNLSMVKKYL
ncbi:MAG: shikimate kinase [Lachnospiraceae bacterium]|nr:shikimate kinase [Lachnospiraceae bacterium]